jgi:hypothetical protein
MKKISSSVSLSFFINYNIPAEWERKLTVFAPDGVTR